VKIQRSIFIIFLLLTIPAFCLAGHGIINIAHRGACGYLPEHTLAAKALAYGMPVHYLEQDLVLSKDGIPVVIHDIHLDTVTDVARVFPDRARKDGRFYAIDLTLAEIKQLKVNERINLKDGKRVFPNRFPLNKSVFRISTLAEEIELIQGLNKSTGKNIGIYPEIKDPAWHQKEGKDISKIVLQILSDYGYKDSDSKCYLQCFDANELKRIKSELKSELKLIQLLEDECDFEEVAGYAAGIGPWIKQIITDVKEDGTPVISDLVKEAHKHNLQVHPYTFRLDAEFYTINSMQLLNILFNQVKIDGIFSDFPDVSGVFIKSLTKE
jgi:glycerophosphoryl diester phosphodiesterase